MVRDANVKQSSSEKALVEANMKVDGLETEVAALKTLVLTSTPSQPNKHLHPQLLADPKAKSRSLPKQQQLQQHQQRGSSPSVPHENGSASSSPHSSITSVSSSCASAESSSLSPPKQIDPVLRKEYLSWKKAPTLDRSHPFLARIYREDIDLCLDFANGPLSSEVAEAVHSNTLSISPVKDFSSSLPRDCALLQSPVLCRYVVKIGDGQGFHVCQLSRNRIAAVCDTLTYLRYIHQGLVKAHVNDVYWEIMQLRAKMAMARLGYPISE